MWDYHAVAGSNRVLTLPLPPALKGADPLPLGAVVRNGPTNDFGVVAVAPSTGKIVFWENVDSAEARSHFPQRNQGVEGSVKLYSGEHITGLVDIDHAGYILIFSSGRLAQLTLRDSQGRPSITTNILSAPNTSGGSFFSFKGLLGGAIRKTVASVKARPSESKGQMELITATKDGQFQMWDISWSGQQIYKREINAHTDILSAVQQGTAPETRSQHDAHILDFAIMDRQHEHRGASLLVLVALTGRNMLDHFLLELDLTDSTSTVSRAIPLRNFHQTELPKEPTGTFLLPRPGHTAFVLLPGVIVVASLAEPEESPEAQLFSDSGRSILPFQDAIYFREDALVRVVGQVLDQTNRKDQVSSAFLFVQDYGVLQITAAPPPSTEEEGTRRKVTAFSKLLQATFFSTIPGNVLDFSTKSRYSFGQADVEKAAISISTHIMSSSFEHFENFTTSMDEQLRRRAFALRTLNAHLRSQYPSLSFAGRWQLLWHAEKLAAAQQLWKWYQDKLQDQKAHPDAYPEKVLMGDIVKALSEKYKTKPDPEKGETDPVRHFFVKDLDSLDVLIPWGWNYLRLFYINTETKERASIMQRLSEANDVMLVTLETAFSFRQTNIDRYGLEADSLQDGILKAGHGYDMLPHFWTSSHNIVASIRSLVDVGRHLAEESFEQGVQEDLAQKIGKDNPRLVRMGCQTHIERFQWALEQTDEKRREMGKTMRDEWNKKVRPGHIYGLMDIGLATDGMNLAEQYRDMPTLVNLIWEESHYLQTNKASSQSKMEQAEITVKLNRINERIGRYFEKYGEEWAEAYYMKHITEGQSQHLFLKETINQEALTKFLRADPSRARLRWINEVCGQKNYDAAAGALYTAASKQETNAWCNKVELSIAKLALLCKKEARPDAPQQAQRPRERPKDEKSREFAFKNVTQQLEYAKIQERVYERLRPTITGALDDESAVQLLMAEFGQGRLAERPALQSLLKQGFDDLIHHRVMEPALLIDVLTLMTQDEMVDATDIVQTNEFAFALRIMFLCWDNFHRTSRQGLLGLIWKRLCIRDNWAEINDTKDMSDESLNDFLSHTYAGWTFKALMKMIGKLVLCMRTGGQALYLTVCVDEDPSHRKVWPLKFEQMYGAGCTDGELCIRFPSEDLRKPIMRDNTLDEAILKEYVEKHRLDDWFQAACRAGKRAYEASKHEGQPQPVMVVVESDDSASLPGNEPPSAEAEPPASETFEGDDEADQDVEMQDS